jgi:bifunctional oligoribonuclease and PAP phosphatase NrnA
VLAIRLEKRHFNAPKKLTKNKEIMFKEFIKKLEKYKHVGVFSHVRPDGDCIGSQVALCKWLQKNGFKVSAYNDDEIPPNVAWLNDFFTIRKPSESDFKDCDVIILVDGNATHRFGEIEHWQEVHDKPLFMIDHHPDPDDVFEEMVSVPSASSTCELVYNLFSEHNPAQIDKEVARALYTGIITDTGSLQFDSVTPKTVEIVADLLRKGEFSPNEIIDKIYSTKTIQQYKLLSKSLATIELYENNHLAVMSVTDKMMEETGTTNIDTEGFVNYPLGIMGVKVAIIFKDLGVDGVKMSLRSRSDVDVNIWARELNGGGHKKAAGAWHPGPLDKAIRETIDIGKKQLQNIE